MIHKSNQKLYIHVILHAGGGKQDRQTKGDSHDFIDSATRSGKLSINCQQKQGRLLFVTCRLRIVFIEMLVLYMRETTLFTFDCVCRFCFRFCSSAIILLSCSCLSDTLTSLAIRACFTLSITPPSLGTAALVDPAWNLPFLLTGGDDCESESSAQSLSELVRRLLLLLPFCCCMCSWGTLVTSMCSGWQCFSWRRMSSEPRLRLSGRKRPSSDLSFDFEIVGESFIGMVFLLYYISLQ